MKMRFFQLAKKISQTSNHPDHQLGSIIIKGNRILSVGVNNTKTHPKAGYLKGLHAELAAIIRAKTDLRGSSIYVYRETKNGQIACSYPCVDCQEAIQTSGIKKIYYSDNNCYRMKKL